MAFQVTQCPNCESTFNVNPSLLHMAAGKVRCGACLTVFNAEENYLDTNQDDGADDDQESVFIGGQPADFFDPSQFLTRSALSEEPEEVMEETLPELGIPDDDLVSTFTVPEHNQDTLLPSATEEFHEDSNPPIEPSRFEPVLPEPEPEVPDTIIEAEESQDDSNSLTEPTRFEPELPESDPEVQDTIIETKESHEDLNPPIEPTRFEPEIPGPEPEVADTTIESEESQDVSNSLTEPTRFEPELPEPEPEVPDTTIESEESHQAFFAAVDDSLGPDIGEEEYYDLQEIAALDPHDDEEMAHFDPFSEEVPDPVASEEPEESKPEETPPPESPQSKQAEFLRRPEEFSMAASFEVKIRPPVMEFGEPPAAESQSEQGEPLDEPVEQTQETTRAEDENLERLVREAIEEQDFAAAIETGLHEPTTITAPTSTETDTGWETGAPEDETDIELFEIGELDEIEEPTVIDDSAISQAPPTHQADATEADFANETDDAITEIISAEEEEPEVDTSTAAIRARALRQELEDEQALEKIPEENLAGLERMATPLELQSRRPGSWGTMLGLLTLILLFGATLAAQYLWRHRADYSADPRFRVAYELVCAQIGCELPEFTAIDAIRSDNLAVRSHPEREDGLMVTVEIRNTAEFPQRFPILILGFNSASNQVIALREFAPQEYLETGLQEIDFMPVASPVQISIPIMDPGSDAVNYTLAFRSP